MIWYGDLPKTPKQKKPYTYEPRAHLIRQDLKKSVLLVDRWIRSKKTGTLAQFVQRSQPHGHLLTANSRGLCMFDALQLASTLQGHPEAIPDSAVASFMFKHKAATKQDLRFGANWANIKMFVKQLMRAGSKLAYNSIAHNHLRQSATSVAVVHDLKLADGFYLVGGFRSNRVGHCFVMQVASTTHIVHEQGEAIDLQAYGEWICQLAFVRRVLFV